jgi:hypothetical protein
LAAAEAITLEQYEEIAGQPTVPHRSFSEKTMKDHDDLVRGAASHKAWLDLLERFSPKQRRDLAMLMAHKWTISAIEIQTSLNSSGKSDKRYDAETSVVQLFPNGPIKPRATGADREQRQGYSDAERYRCIRNAPYSDQYGDLYAMTFQGDGDVPVKGDELDALCDAAIAKATGATS